MKQKFDLEDGWHLFNDNPYPWTSSPSTTGKDERLKYYFAFYIENGLPIATIGFHSLAHLQQRLQIERCPVQTTINSTERIEYGWEISLYDKVVKDGFPFRTLLTGREEDIYELDL